MSIQLYPDETIYSVCARIHSRVGGSANKTSSFLFGKRNINHPLWPRRLENFAQYLGLDPLYLLNKHTNYPYYDWVFSSEKRTLLKEAILKDNGNPTTIIGLKGRYKPRLCPLCLKEDMKVYGEPYWHRTHQLPGSLVCHIHNVLLISDCTKCEEAFKLQVFRTLQIAPLFCNKGHSLTKIVYNKSESLMLISQENHNILNKDWDNNVLEIQERMRQYALIAGYMNVSSPSISFERLYPKFFSEFPQSLLDALGIPIKNVRQGWMMSVFRNKARSINPLHYLLVMIFLAGNVKSFFESNVKYVPYGNGPWPCLNGACKHYKHKVINNVDIVRTEVFGKPLGIFQCEECGFTYGRSGHDRNENDVFRYSSIKETGDVWNEAFQKMLHEDVVYIRNIALTLNVGAAFIKSKIKDNLLDFNLLRIKGVDQKKVQRNRLLKILSDTPSELRSTVESNVVVWLRVKDKEWLDQVLPSRSNVKRHRYSIEYRKERFLELLEKYPTASRSQLRKYDSSNYSWLYRNANEWLQAHIPTIQEQRGVALKISRERRRTLFLDLRNENPHFNRAELKAANMSNYTWLGRYDAKWLADKLPEKNIKGKRPRVSKEKRREELLGLLEKYPDISNSELSNLSPRMFNWLKANDKEWLSDKVNIKKRVSAKTRTLSIEQRRNLFLEILNANPIASRTQLRNICQGNYRWLLTYDYEWLKKHLPPIVSCNRSINKKHGGLFERVPRKNQ